MEPLAFKPRNDRITLAGVKISPCIGTTPEERSAPQECEVDLTLWLDLEAAAATDSLEVSVDYSRVLAAIQEISAAREYQLMETLAYAIVRTVLGSFPAHRVNLKLRKRPASLAGQIDFVEVEVEES